MSATGTSEDFLVAAVVILGLISLGTTLWIAQNRKKERVEAGSKLEGERKYHRQELDATTRALDDLTRKCENKELKLLIQPLFLAFDKYPDDPRIIKREKFGLSMLWSLMSPEPTGTYSHVEKADTVINAMQQHGNLAQPELRDLIRDFLEFKQAQKDGKTKIHDPYFEETVDKVEKIRDLAASRYNELMWGKTGPR